MLCSGDQMLARSTSCAAALRVSIQRAFIALAANASDIQIGGCWPIETSAFFAPYLLNAPHELIDLITYVG